MSKERKVYTNCESISADKTRVAGTVKWYDPRKGYGFITTVDANPTDYFVHRTQVYSEDHFPRRPILRNHETVEFTVIDTPQGPAAAEVSLPGAVIIPSRRLFFRRSRRAAAPATDATPTVDATPADAAPTNEVAPKTFRPKRRSVRKPRAEKPAADAAPADAPADAAPAGAPADAAAPVAEAKPKTRRSRRHNRKPRAEKPAEAAPAADAAAPASTTPAEAPKEPAASEK